MLSQRGARLFSLCLLLGAGSAWSEQSPREYLNQMSHSFRELDYRGEFTYEYGSHMDSLRIVHGVRNGVEQERLVYLNGEPREVVRDGHRLSCIHPGDQIMRLGTAIASGPFAHGFQADVDISRLYSLDFGESTRVAGRPVRQIVVRPKDQYRYGFHLYLDRQTGLLLKRLTISPAGKILERFQFTRIEIGGNIEDSELLAADGGSNQAFHYVLEHSSTAGLQIAVAGWLPPGFALSARNVQHESGSEVQLSMYTDGFSTLTLVLESSQADAALADGKARRGATVAYMRQLAVDDQPYLLTVVGEVPLRTAKKVAQNVAIEQG